MPKNTLNIHKIILPTQPGERLIQIFIKAKHKLLKEPVIQLVFTQEDPIYKAKAHTLRFKKYRDNPKYLVATFYISNTLRNVFSTEKRLHTHNDDRPRPSSFEDETLYLETQLIANTISPKRDQLLDIRHLQFVVPRVMNVALMGDSYAAGLGTGRYDLSDPLHDPGAYRSSRSGMHRLMTRKAKEFRINYINVTYAGAQMLEGNEEKEKFRPKSSLVYKKTSLLKPGSQLAELITQLKCQPLDFLFLSGGGNDIYENEKGKSGLEYLVKRMFANLGNVPERLDIKISRGLENMEKGYELFFELLDAYPNLKETKVIISTYPDMTKNEEGIYTNPKRTNNHDKDKIFKGYTKKELKYLYENVLDPLNRSLINISRRYPRCYINDVMKENGQILYHGMTSNEPWFNLLRENMKREDEDKNRPGKKEAFHPNFKGQKEIYYKTFKKVFERLTEKKISFFEVTVETIDFKLPK